MEVAPTLLLLFATYWLIGRQMRQMTGGFPGLGEQAGREGEWGRGGGLLSGDHRVVT
jgi:AFG3 family protein